MPNASTLRLFKKIKMSAIVIAVSTLSFTGCTTEVDTHESDANRLVSAQRELKKSLEHDGHTVYGSAAGKGGQERSVQIELPLQRDGVSIFGSCTHARGKADVRLDNKEKFTIICTEHGEPQKLTDSLELKGIRLLITVEDAPTQAIWAISASTSRHG